MKKVNLLKKSWVVGVILVFICSSFVSSIGGYSEEANELDIDIEDVCELKENVLVTCNTFGFPGEPSQETSMSQSDAEFLYEKIKELQFAVSRDPLSDKTQQLQHEIITLADEHNLLPSGLSVETLKSRLTPTPRLQHPKLKLPRLQNKASEMFCNYVSTGSGSALPIIILPRLIPILLTPIPRLFVRWSTLEGITSCGGLRSGTGFIATGAQNGIALGFWGIGFSIFLPPVMAYGLFGYALFASVTAEEIELWPPNYPPEITVISPPNGAENVPVSTSELTFQIKDYNEDLMNYTVTTDPDIGSGSGNNKPDGTYTVPISGLEGTEEYTWHVQVSDGVNVVDISSSFTTETVAPIVSDPVPEDGKRYVPLDLSQLSFYLSDPQGDLMDYTVETSPDIGSGSGTKVGEGTYSVNVGGLDYSQDYKWFVNVTDGTNWKHKVFIFQTEPIMVFNPFDEGWQYRKNITIDHTKVAGDLTNFPVLVSTVDADLRDNAQDDGDDILFMNDTGVATRLYHEIEHYERSSGELVAWVNVTDLASDEDGTLYMYYGNPSCCNQQAPELVWDSNFIGVYHMSESIENMLDSTNNNRDIQVGNAPTYRVSGRIGKAMQFDGENDYFEKSNYYDVSTLSAVTLEIWMELPSSGWGEKHPYAVTLGRGNNYVQALGLRWTGRQNSASYKKFQMVAARYAIPDYALSTMFDPGSGFYYQTGIYTNNYVTIYVDSIQYENNTASNNNFNDFTDDYIEIGRANRKYVGWEYHSGKFDEIRISKIVRSSEWISTSYNNQNDPSSFLSFGPEETGP